MHPPLQFGLIRPLRNTRKTERCASRFLFRWAVRAAPFALFLNTRKTERCASRFLFRWAVRAAPFALFLNTRKTERCASRFLFRWAVRAAPFALFTALLTATAYNPSWKDSPVAQWSDDDAKQLLSDSPWSKSVHLDKVRNLSLFERRDGGDWEAGIPTGIGMEELGLFADWREIEAFEHAYAVSKLGTVTVRWESALPVRAAEAKIGDNPEAGWTGDYYAIAVHDLRPPFRWNLANQLKGVAFLKRDKKRDVKPARVVVLPRANGLATFVYLFPRSVEITKKDRSLAFVAQIGRLFISVNFFPEDMRMDGELEL